MRHGFKVLNPLFVMGDKVLSPKGKLTVFEDLFILILGSG
jgi:hypothetical protein